MSLRLAVLLADVDVDLHVPPMQWRHRDGRPLTNEESRLLWARMMDHMGTAENRHRPIDETIPEAVERIIGRVTN